MGAAWKRDALEREVTVSEVPSMTAFGALTAARAHMDTAVLNEALRKVIGRIHVAPGKFTPDHVRIYGRWADLPEKPALVPIG